jgi:phosphatidylinositol alpha-1,6-mannosyltransferase
MSNYFAGLASHFPGDSVVVLTGRGMPGNLDGQIKVYRAPLRSGGWLTVPVWCAVALRAVLRERVDLVICGNASPFRYVAAWLRHLLGIPYVIHFFGNDLLRLHRRMRPSAVSRVRPRSPLDSASLVIGCSRYTSNAAIELLGIEPTRVVTTYPGLDPHLLGRDVPLPMRAPGEPLRLVSVGRLAPRKGFDTVIRAMALLKSDAEPVDVVYTLVGKGDQGPLRQLAEELGVANRVHFAGFLPARAEIDAAVMSAHLLVMPSRVSGKGTDVEGFGMVYIEAAALKRPAVAGGSGGAPEAVVDGQTGLVVHDPESARAVADAIRRFASDNRLLQRCAQQAWERANGDFRWPDIAGALWREMAGRARPVKSR